jgi:gliding motility-associated-like protein
MQSRYKKIEPVLLSRVALLFLVLVSFAGSLLAQPANDSCSRATVIAIPAGGYGLGTFTSAQTDMSSATIQAGETFAPAIFVAALNKKSVWYKFSIPTIRAVRVTLTQPGTTITAGDVGFSVYEANSCLPGTSNISTKLTPIVTFGNTYHPCVPSGDYLIQVSSNNNANGPITVQVEISDQTGAAYDHPNQAYAFGTVGYYARKIDFNTECQSIEDATEVCNGLANKNDYNKSAWLTFTTPAYFDYLVVQLSGTGTTSYFPSNNNQAIKRKFGYTLYQGNAVTTPIGSLTTLAGCDSLETDGYYAAYRMYKCTDLQPNTTYSIQLFIKKDFGDDVRLGILTGGQSPTKAPKPVLSQVPAPNAIGNLAASPNGTLTTVDDVWGCNSRHNTSNCGPALPDTGVVYTDGGKYNLSSFITFTLTTTCAVNFNGYVMQCSSQPLIRVFKQGLTNNCTGLDTMNLIGTFLQTSTLDCLAPGDYTVQVLGRDPTDWYGRFTYGTPTYNAEQCLSYNLGTAFRLDIRAYNRKAANKYSLDAAGAYDSINMVSNVMQPLLDRVAYSAMSDTMGCRNTLRPVDTTCSPVNNKVMYREFVVIDSGIVDFSNLTMAPYNSTPWRYKLYSGDANALASAQNVFAFPDKVTGLIPKTECMDGYTNCTNKTACVLPGTYTFTTMGGDGDVGRVDRPVFTLVKTRTLHNSPLTAQNLGSVMDTLGPNGGTIKTDVDDWSCTDNAVPINGVAPCSVGGKTATKAIYRQFYLKADAIVRIDNEYYYYCYGRAYGTRTLFYGKATNGFAGLTPVGGGWSCFQQAGSTGGCDLLTAGWYTVVSYNQGPSYDSTMRSLNLEGRYNSSVGYNDEFKITITPTCAAPKYNRPYRAAVDTGNQPFLITWGDRPGSTPAYTKRDSTYALPTEHFNCTVDTPFANHPIKACQSSSNRVAYYVFKTTQVGFLQINAGGYYAAIFNKDVRIDSAQFNTLTPLQPCSNVAGFIQFCFFQPGTYTLAIFAGDADVCKAVTPSIYMDEIGYSRFDYAKNAYDFGLVPPDSAYHYGKVGDVNPLNSGRKPSHDYFYCTTGASSTDPTDPVCYTAVNPNVYSTGPNKPLYDSTFLPSNGITRRNIWYTFVVDQPGYVKVRVQGKGPRKEWQPKFSVYKSDVDAALPFSTVVSTGLVDSTTAQGLTHIGTNQQNWYYCANLYDDVSFYRDPCSAIPTRYYILVENINGEPYENGGALPNTQQEVSIMIDSVNLVLPKHDHYSQAGDIGTVGVGTFTGDIDNYSCATKDPTDPIYYYGGSPQCQKTLWYKFTATITGNVRYRIRVDGALKNDYYDVQLFRQMVPGDSTSTGLQIIGYQGVYGSDNTYWSQTCVYPGTYYLLLPGCAQVRAYEYPEIQLIEATGDFCSRAVPAVLNGPGAVTASLVVDCHTIGSDYGEFGPQLTCPQAGVTADYKSSWFRMDIGGTDTLDVTTFLVESTNASSSDIKYRMMTGDCGAMQEQSCVLDALTQNTYQCLVPGQSYYIQVFTPTSKFNQQVTGTIDLKLSAISHADTCAPKNNCLANSNFIAQFNCATDTAVRFVNYSTFGSSIQYKWDFGYAGKTSTAVSPIFNYPALATAQTYNVTLKVQNTACTGRDSVTIPITIPGRPNFDLGADTSLCSINAATILNAATWTGSSYKWNTGDTTSSITVSSQGAQQYAVKVTYNGCVKNDTIWVYKNPIVSKKQTSVICPAQDSIQLTSNRNQGETYSWNNGLTASSIWVKTPGNYYNSITWHGCTIIDTFIVAAPIRPFPTDTSFCLTASIVLNASSTGAIGYQWQNGASGPSFNITSAGQYWVQINYPNCNVRDTINVTGLQPLIRTTNASICGGQTYTLPSGLVVSTAGIYNDTARSVAGCDSVISSVVLAVKSRLSQSTSATLCSGQTYTLPWGAVVNTGGVYTDTLKYANGGCDSLVRTVILTIKNVQHNTTGASVCAGQTYTLPSGVTVNLTGSYIDTLRYVSGCDSLITTTSLLVKPLYRNNNSITLCQGQTYTLPSGAAVTSSGIYNDTVRYKTGCDSLISAMNIVVKSLTRQASATSICAGQTYALPSGKVISTAGVYNDTIRYTTGCDSLISAVTLAVKALTRSTSNASICFGQTYTLPSGAIASTAGTYVDTAKYISACDSVISTITLSVKQVTKTTSTAAICPGQTYILPSGRVVTSTGTYNDTIRYTTGCDSLITTVTLTVKPVTRNTSAASICEGQTYTLPSGKIISTTGAFSDTIKYINGCDSLITTLTLTVKKVTRTSLSPAICAGQTYVLPSGKVVNSTGAYVDTVKYTTGCDSLISNINLSVKSVTKTTVSPVICAGQAYTSPSGKTYNATGAYSDTVKYTNGCDSLVTTINLLVKTVTRATLTPSICATKTYTLPSGIIVSASGSYADTLRYISGCDSVINTINLTVQNVTRVTSAASICAGQNYILPSGKTVSTAGTFADTVKYRSGCDSLISTITITLRTTARVSTSATICQGQTYNLPSGKALTITGIYSDTLRYTLGCDSVITTLNLVVKAVTKASASASICLGQTYTLPSGKIVNTTGIHNDTIRYSTGCDSIITTLNLQVYSPLRTTINPSICVGQAYTLPSGNVVSIAGNYLDTIKNLQGCDSIINTIKLSVNPNPTVALSKSNDINCITGSAALTATGGVKYVWSPPTGLSNPLVYNPVASPAATTMYKAAVTSARGCTSADSIQVNVNTGNSDGGYLLPSAFTPNGDNKNDCFGVKTWGWITELQFTVFDRWGNILFATTDPAKCWDGSYNGLEQGTGAYVYSITAKTICGPIVRKGTIVLIR